MKSEGMLVVKIIKSSANSYHRALGPVIPILKLYRQVHPWWTGRNSNPTVGMLGRGLRAHTSSSMAANAGIIFSACVTAQMEATVGFSFTFGSFPEVTVPRNPASGSPVAGGNVVAGDRSDLTPKCLPLLGFPNPRALT